MVKFFMGVILGVMLMALVSACASPTFNYRYYPYDIQDHTLMGAKPADDLSDKVCDANQANKYPCTVMMSHDFFNLKKDLLETKSALIRCQQGN